MAISLLNMAASAARAVRLDRIAANITTIQTMLNGGTAGQVLGQGPAFVDPPSSLPSGESEDDVLAIVGGVATWQDLATLFSDSGFIRTGTVTPTWDGMTLSTATGRYIRIGNLVMGQLQLVVSSAGSGSLAAWLRAAIPFDCRSGQDYPVVIGEYDNITTSGHQLIGYVRAGTDDIALRLCRDGSTAINLTRDDVATGATLMVHFSYETDAP